VGCTINDRFVNLFFLAKKPFLCYNKRENMLPNNNDALIQFIQKRPHLVWYVKDLKNLSQDSIIEHTLNYGDWADVQEMIRILGIQNVANNFRQHIDKQRSNYRPEIKNYFQLYFNHYVA